jgi:hypothetical protein
LLKNPEHAYTDLRFLAMSPGDPFGKAACARFASQITRFLRGKRLCEIATPDGLFGKAAQSRY